MFTLCLTLLIGLVCSVNSENDPENAKVTFDKTMKHLDGHHIPGDDPIDFVGFFRSRPFPSNLVSNECEEGFFQYSWKSSRENPISPIRLFEGDILDISDHPVIVRHFCNNTIQRAEFILNGKPVQSDKRRPFSISGDDHFRKKFYPWKMAEQLVRQEGFHHLEVRGFSRNGVTPLVTKSIHLRVSRGLSNIAGHYFAEKRIPSLIQFTLYSSSSHYGLIRSLYHKDQLSENVLMTTRFELCVLERPWSNVLNIRLMMKLF